MNVKSAAIESFYEELQKHLASTINRPKRLDPSANEIGTIVDIDLRYNHVNINLKFADDMVRLMVDGAIVYFSYQNPAFPHNLVKQTVDRFTK